MKARTTKLTTPQLVESIVTLIEKASNRKLTFSPIVNMKTGEMTNVMDRIAAWIDDHHKRSVRELPRKPRKRK